MKFIDMKAFYEARGGARSPECDFGVWWWRGIGGGPHRVTWVETTGDVYALHRHPLAGDPQVELLATIPGRANIEAQLAGWAVACGAPDSLRWVEERLSSGAAGSSGTSGSSSDAVAASGSGATES